MLLYRVLPNTDSPDLVLWSLKNDSDSKYVPKLHICISSRTENINKPVTSLIRSEITLTCCSLKEPSDIFQSIHVTHKTTCRVWNSEGRGHIYQNYILPRPAPPDRCRCLRVPPRSCVTEWRSDSQESESIVNYVMLFFVVSHYIRSLFIPEEVSAVWRREKCSKWQCDGGRGGGALLPKVKKHIRGRGAALTSRLWPAVKGRARVRLLHRTRRSRRRS